MDKVAFMSMDVESFYDTSCVKNKIPYDPKYNCAIDVQRYVHFLDKHNIHGTFFVVVDFIKECKEYLLEAIEHGHDIGLHCLHHRSLKKLTVAQFKEEIVEAKRIMKEELGVETIGFRFPRFEFKKSFFKVLKEEGFIFDSSVITPDKKYQKIKDYVFYKDGLYEFSPNSWRFPFKTVLLSGGGYCRFLKGKALNNVLGKHIKKHDSFLIYFHPFEIHQGYLPVPKNILQAQKMYLTKNRETYLDFLDKVIAYLLEQGYEFLTFKDFVKNYQKD